MQVRMISNGRVAGRAPTHAHIPHALVPFCPWRVKQPGTQNEGTVRGHMHRTGMKHIPLKIKEFSIRTLSSLLSFSNAKPLGSSSDSGYWFGNTPAGKQRILIMPSATTAVNLMDHMLMRV